MPLWYSPNGSAGGRAVGIAIDGYGTAIGTGLKGYVTSPFSGTISGWYLVADQEGDIVFDVWRKANPDVPTITDTITASSKPTLSGAQTGVDTSLTGWDTEVNVGDIFGFYVDSASTVTRVTLVLIVN